MSSKDYYKILGVPKDVSSEDLKQAYRKLAMRYHPDRNPGDEKAKEKFQEIGEAYEVLRDPEKRAAYDHGGSSWASAFSGGANAGGAAGFDFSDIFNDFFGGGSRDFSSRDRSASTRGSDLENTVSISLSDAFYGKKVSVSFRGMSKCTSCSGTGGANGSKPVTCSSCKGSGVVRAQKGFFAVEMTCSQCSGLGEMIVSPCTKCRGEGRLEEGRTVSVAIPPGIDSGMKIRLSGEGDAGRRGGAAGDFYLNVRVKSHDFFVREKSSLKCRLPVSMVDAALGAEVDVPHLDGERYVLKIPVGTQSGTELRMRDKGMPIMRSSKFGDLLVTIQVETPVNLSKKQREILEHFREETGDKSLGPLSERLTEFLKKGFGSKKK